MNRSQKLEKDMAEMHARLVKKDKSLAKKKANEIEIPTCKDLDYVIQNSKQYS